MQKLIDKCKTNYSNMTPLRRSQLLQALRLMAAAPFVLLYIGYEDGWRKVAGLLLFGLVLVVLVLIIGFVGLGVQKLFGGTALGEKIGTFIGVCIFLAFLVGAFMFLVGGWGR